FGDEGLDRSGNVVAVRTGRAAVVRGGGATQRPFDLRIEVEMPVDDSQRDHRQGGRCIGLDLIGKVGGNGPPARARAAGTEAENLPDVVHAAGSLGSRPTAPGRDRVASLPATRRLSGSRWSFNPW